ncbi:DUF6770 family protein [Gramella sp. MAR_2010_147]|uniref:DUF6770 family protein n=1 Tax=Gramella sp. MAR_2010_147 TaxID=1250205 RepID=UPI0008796E12|nr:DUF6770 family protein [Gramella sp. MAR_2010_147]SDS54382.1 hypothetical protein SAMN04488553_2500 [Gramella sp. MAR_2010_147]
MKNSKLLVFCFLLTTLCFGQSRTLDNITDFKLRNSGAMLSHEKNVDGYYFFYEIDKKSRKDREFGIQILDKNLNELALKSYVAHKRTQLIDGRYNNEAIMFALLDNSEKQIKLVSFDKNAQKLPDETISLSNREYKLINLYSVSNEYFPLYAIPNKGFIFNKVTDDKKIGYDINFYPTGDSKPWSYSSPEGAKDMFFITPLDVNEEFIVFLEYKKGGLLSRQVDVTTKILNAATGELIIEKKYEEDNPRLITNAFLKNDNHLILMGEYFKPNAKILNDKSEGVFLEELDGNGQSVRESLVNWDENIYPYMQVEERDNSYVFFHDLIQTGDGKFFAIGEKFKKTVSALGVASLALGGGGSATQLTISDAVVFEFKPNFELQEIKTFEKGTSRVLCATDFGSPQLNARALVNYGAFDYTYTQNDPEKNRFYSSFVDYERIKGEKNKNAFKTLIYDYNEISEDKIYLERGDINSSILPAKLGNVLIVEYDKKEKTITAHLEKMNIK